MITIKKFLESLIRYLPLRVTSPILLWKVKKNVLYTASILSNNTPKTQYPKGVNIIGNVTSTVGLGQQSRIIAEPLLKSKIDVCALNSNLSNYTRKENLQEIEIVEHPIYNCNIVTLSIQKFAEHYHKILSKNNFFDRFNISYTAWEWNQYPSSWVPLANKFDEFWAMSSFVQNSAKKSLKIPVLLMPYAIDFPEPKLIKKSQFGISENKFIFMFSYDFFSNFYRKNPLAVIEAFKNAFTGNEDVELVIKVSMVDYYISHKRELQRLLSFIELDKRIKIINTILSNSQMKELLNICDVYVSLHRAEGFGLGIAEAMKLGKAVIATNYSGNTDFTKENNSCLVGYKLSEVKPSESLYYEKGQMWAEPDIEEASNQMKNMYNNRTLYNKISKSGQEFINQNYNNQIVGKRFKDRLKKVGVL